MKHSACMQSRRSPKSVRPKSYHQGKTSDKKIEKTKGNAMDLGNLDNASKTDDEETRQEEFDPWQSTLAKAPRSLTHQACTPLDTNVKEKEDGPSTATATTVASLGMRGGTAHAWMKLAKPRWLNVRASFSRAVKRRTMG